MRPKKFPDWNAIIIPIELNTIAQIIPPQIVSKSEKNSNKSMRFNGMSGINNIAIRNDETIFFLQH